MTKKSKIFVGCGVAIIIPVIAFIGLIFFIGSDKEYTELHKIALEEGNKFGKTTDQNGCLKQGLLRMADVKEPTINQLASNGRFVNECLDTSKPSPDFCKDVPKVIVRDWIHKQCELIGSKNDAVCYVVFDEKTTFCAGL